MKKLLFLAVPLSLTTAAVSAQVLPPGQIVAPKAPPKPAAELTEKEIRGLGEGIAFPYDRLELVLGTYVDKNSDVMYAKVKGNNDLETFVRAVAIADLRKFPVWKVPADPDVKGSKETEDHSAELVFWINAYNGLFLKAVADAYPVNSVFEIKDLDTAKTRIVAGKNYSFAQLREKIAAMDPRALFALNSGMRGGPQALPLALRYSTLDRDLDAVVAAYINNETLVALPNRLQNSVTVSEWLKLVDSDFKPKTAKRQWDGIRYLLATYTRRDADQRYYISGDFNVQFGPADTHINEQLTH